MSRYPVHPRRLLAALVAVVLLVTLAPLSAGATASPPTLSPDGTGSATFMATVTHPSPAAGDYFGAAVSVEGTWAVIGAPFASVPGTASGFASAYNWTSSGGWGFVSDLEIPKHEAFQYVGWGTGVSGSQLFVGCPQKPGGAGNMTGVVYVYDASSGTPSLVQTITVASGDGGGQFGRAIAIDGDTMVISAPYAYVGATPCGAVFVFKKEFLGWTLSQRLDPSDTSSAPEDGQFFGESVAIQGDDLVVGSPFQDTNRGHVYTFRRSGASWSYFGEHFLPTGVAHDFYGRSVAVCNGYLAIGAPGRDASGATDAGAAYVSKWITAPFTGWQQIADLESESAPFPYEGFGHDVALRNDDLLVGSSNGPGPGGVGNSRTVYHYTVNPAGAGYAGIVADAVNPGGDNYGVTLAFDGDTMLVGGPAYTLPAIPGAGYAWFYGGLRTARVRVDRTLSVRSPGLMGNDVSNGGTMTTALLSGPAHGIATVKPDGSWTYDPTSWFIGTETFRYSATNSQGTTSSTVTVQVYAPPTKTATSISIKSTSYNTLRSKTFNLTGVLSPGRYLDPCMVWVKKPGRSYWSYSSARLAYSITPNVGANWWYRYNPRTVPRGTYAFRASFAGDADRLPSWSGIIYVRIR